MSLRQEKAVTLFRVMLKITEANKREPPSERIYKHLLV